VTTPPPPGPHGLGIAMLLRSAVARAAWGRGGAGTHRSGKPRRQRSRSDAKRAALREQEMSADRPRLPILDGPRYLREGLPR
jgi:hypothetical protein